MDFDTQQEPSEPAASDKFTMTAFFFIHYISWAAFHLALSVMAAVSTAIISLLPELVVPAVLLLELILGSAVPLLLSLGQAYLASPLWAAFKGWAVSASSGSAVQHWCCLCCVSKCMGSFSACSGLRSSTGAVSVVTVCTAISMLSRWCPTPICCQPGCVSAGHICLTSCSACLMLLEFVYLLCLLAKTQSHSKPQTQQHKSGHCLCTTVPVLQQSLCCDCGHTQGFLCFYRHPSCKPIDPTTLPHVLRLHAECAVNFSCPPRPSLCPLIIPDPSHSPQHAPPQWCQCTQDTNQAGGCSSLVNCVLSG